MFSSSILKALQMMSCLLDISRQTVQMVQIPLPTVEDQEKTESKKQDELRAAPLDRLPFNQNDALYSNKICDRDLLLLFRICSIGFCSSLPFHPTQEQAFTGLILQHDAKAWLSIP